MSKKIQVGYGSGKPLSQKTGLYGGRSGGKLTRNGGFNGLPTVTFTSISEDKWVEIFGVDSMPKWKRELYEAGEPCE